MLLCGLLYESRVWLGVEQQPVQARSRFPDFMMYYMAGELVRSSARESIYSPEQQLQVFNRLLAPTRAAKCHFLQYPPFFFVMLAPLSVWPYQVAERVWQFSLTFLGITALVVFMSRRMRAAPRQIAFTVLAGLCSAPMWIAIVVGQASWLILALFSMFFLFLLERKAPAAGAFLSLSTIKPQYAALLATAALSGRRFKLVAFAALFELGLLVLSCCVVGWQNVLTYPSILFHAETTADYSGVYPQYMIGVRGLLSSFLEPRLALVSSTVLMLPALAAIYCLWKVSLKAKDQEVDNWVVALTVLLCLIFSPHIHIYDDTLLLLPAALTLVKIEPAGTSDGAIARTAPYLLWKGILIIFPLLSWVLLTLDSSSAIRRIPFLVVNLLLLASGTLCLRTLVKAKAGELTADVSSR